MLVGTLRYKNPATGLWELFDIKGVDSSSVFTGTISTYSGSAIDLMDGVEGSGGLGSRRFNINMSSVKVQTVKVWDEEKGKEVNKAFNTDFFVTIGAVLRYAKSHCYVMNSTSYTGFGVASAEYSPESESEYLIPIDKRTADEEQQYLGRVVLSLGEIKELSLKTDIVEWELKSIASDEQFYDFKISTTKGFKFDEEHLKLYVKPPVVKKVSGDGLYTSLDEIIKNNPDKDYMWLLGRSYYIVDDDMLEEVCEKFKNHEGKIAYDSETTGLNITFKSRLGQGDQLVGVVLSYQEGESYYFPLQHKCIKNLCGGDHWFFMTRYMKPILEGKKLIAHNMTFDWKVAYIYDINANIVDDTMAIFKLTIGAEKEDFKVGLKELTRLFLNRDSLELSNLVADDSWGESDIRFWDLPYELVRLYASADTDNTLALYNYAMNNDILHKYNAEKVYEIEILFSYAVAYQEFYGHKIDTDKIDDLRRRVDEGIAENYKKLVDIVGYEFNPNSSQQLKRIMYDELGLPKQINRKTGNLSTDKNALKVLKDIKDINDKPMYPFAKILQDYRDYETLRKNFIKNLPELATPDGYIFSEVQQYGTTTGRVSIKKPNYQSYNDVVKRYIIPRPGFYATDNDYSSIEYRVLGSMAQQPALIKAFDDPELDYHSYQASRMFNVPYEAVTSKLRKSAKGINFGLPYGMGDKSLGVAIFGEESPENTRQAGVLRKKYFVGQEKIQDFFEYHRNKGVNLGYTETHYGRRRYYHKNKFSEAKIRRQAGNQVIQGSAADIYKLAVGRLFLRVCKEGWLGKVMFTGFVHDEIFCEVHNSIDPVKWLKVVRECFEVDIEGFCKLFVGFGFGANWYQAKKTEIPTKLQIEMVEKWGETGYPEWDGDGKKFADSIPAMIHDYEIRATIDSITAEENQGKVIKPMINTYLTEIVAGDRKLIKDIYLKALSSVVDDNTYSSIKESEDGLVSIIECLKTAKGVSNIEDLHDFLQPYFAEEHIDTVVYAEIEKPRDLQENLDIFCRLHGVDRSKVNQLSTAPVEKKDDKLADGVVPEEVGFDFGLDDAEKEAERQRLKNARIDTYGMYTDFNENSVTLKLINNQTFMNAVKTYLNNEGSGMQIFLKDVNTDKLFVTPMYIEGSNLTKLQDLYLSYFKQLQEHLNRVQQSI